jgi:DNA-binding response OmpR family regulator
MTTKTIGLFEDDPKLLRMYGDFLRGKGYQVFEARDAKVGLALVGRVAPDLVLLDVMMPQMSGIEACKRLRESLGEDVPIVFLTSLDDVDTVRAALEAGGSDFLTKSTSLEVVHEHVQAWLARAPGADASERRRRAMTALDELAERQLLRL